MAQHICPFWVGYLLTSPLRRWFEPYDVVLDNHVGPDMTVVDVGSAMGYFSLEMARRVGQNGRVVAVDLQPRMLEVLRHRAARAGVADRIETRVCSGEDLGLADLASITDFVLAAHMVHEATDGAGILRQAFHLLKPGGILVVIEPQGHVTEQMFDTTRTWGRDIGFEEIRAGLRRRVRAATFRKPVYG